MTLAALTNLRPVKVCAIGGEGRQVEVRCRGGEEIERAVVMHLNSSILKHLSGALDRALVDFPPPGPFTDIQWAELPMHLGSAHLHLV